MDHPSDLFKLLGETLPKVCGFFCDYVIIRAFTGMSMELVRAYALLPGILAVLTCKKKWGRSPVGTTVEVTPPSPLPPHEKKTREKAVLLIDTSR